MQGILRLFECFEGGDIARNAYESLFFERGAGEISVKNDILVVGEGDLARDFVAKAAERFELTQTPIIAGFGGVLGSFSVNLGAEILTASQIVFFAKHLHGKAARGEAAPRDKTAQKSPKNPAKTTKETPKDSPRESAKTPLSGIHYIDSYENLDALIAALEGFVGDFTYQKSIKYDPAKCQYHHKSHRSDDSRVYCALCEGVCPTSAIVRDDAKKELRLSDLDCVFCGLCVGVCPSGAMQKLAAPLDSLTKVARNYEGRVALLLGREDLARLADSLGADSLDSVGGALGGAENGAKNPAVENAANPTGANPNLAKNTANPPLPRDFLPLVLPNINMLNEVYLLSLIQETAAPVVVFGEAGEILRESCAFINDIFMRIFGREAVFLAENLANLAALKNLENLAPKSLPNYRYNAEEGEFLREIFAARLRFLVKDLDFGVVESRANAAYGEVKVAQNCTLCMSCVESCNANALISAKDGFELLFNPALCTVCGVCADVCPEKSISLENSGLSLKNAALSYQSRAKDTPFKCVECGKIFASARSIERVKSLISPLFLGDETRQRTLFCCPDCKVRVMFKAQISKD